MDIPILPDLLFTAKLKRNFKPTLSIGWAQ